MTKNLFRLELLPNEILIDLFRYFHPRDLFQAFYNLNSHFNILLQTLHYLSLTLSTNYSNKDDYFPYIRILIINRAVDINLNYFSQIHHLILRYPTDKLLNQLNNQTLPYLKHLRINHMHISVLNRISDVCEKIFSNTFSNLESCYLFEWGTITKIQNWTQLPSLRILKVGTIDLLVYKAILSVCPNLYFLQLATILPNNTHFNINQHRNLKRMIIRTTAFVQPWKDEDISCCFSYVPYLEYLSLHRTDMMIVSKYDWLAPIIACYLPFLRQFDFYLHAEIFQHNQYQSRFIINRTQLF
jgi:hypothetical protein